MKEPPAQHVLFQKGIEYGCLKARQITRRDYECHDYIIAMDENNLHNLKKLLGEDVDNKISLMMSHAGKHRDVADPWYTGDFEKTFNDITEGCTGFLKELE